MVKHFIYGLSLCYVAACTFTGCSTNTNPGASPTKVTANNEQTFFNTSGEPVVIPTNTDVSPECIQEYMAATERSLNDESTTNIGSQAISAVNKNSSLAKTKVSYRDFVVMVWDGFSNGEQIFSAFSSAASSANGWSSYSGLFLQSGNSPSEVKSKIDAEVAAYGKPRSQLNLLIIGKSLGGAKTYKMSHTYHESFNDFNKVAMVLVDPHEPGAPGDQGRADYWYDYVHFRRHSSWAGNYDLTFTGNHANYFGKLGIYSTYQRSYWPRGYMFTTNAKRLTRQYCDHTAIANSSTTISVIKDAIEYLVQ